MYKSSICARFKFHDGATFFFSLFCCCKSLSMSTRLGRNNFSFVLFGCRKHFLLFLCFAFDFISPNSSPSSIGLSPVARRFSTFFGRTKTFHLPTERVLRLRFFGAEPKRKLRSRFPSGRKCHASAYEKVMARNLTLAVWRHQESGFFEQISIFREEWNANQNIACGGYGNMIHGAASRSNDRWNRHFKRHLKAMGGQTRTAWGVAMVGVRVVLKWIGKWE